MGILIKIYQTQLLVQVFTQNIFYALMHKKLKICNIDFWTKILNSNNVKSKY